MTYRAYRDGTALLGGAALGSVLGITFDALVLGLVLGTMTGVACELIGRRRDRIATISRRR